VLGQLAGIQETINTIKLPEPPISSKLESIGPKLIYVGDQFQVNWTVAASECTYMVGYLATIKDPEDIDFTY